MLWIAGPRPVRRVALLALAVSALAGAGGLATGCATAGPGVVDGSGDRPIRVVAAENSWGSLAGQLGGSRVEVISVIDSPAVDPHDYEPTVADARAVALARVVVLNGVGYDPWAGKLVDANPAPGRAVLNVGDLVGARPGDNPHRWYDPDDVRRVVDAISRAYEGVDPAHAAFYRSRHDEVLGTALKGYFDAIGRIRATYAGTPVGASESIFSMLAPALGLTLITPPSFLVAITEGSDPTAADKATIDRQISNRELAVYVYNSQNATPDIQAQIVAARRAGIPVTTITETLTPAGRTFQDWQVAQLTALAQALARATGRQ